MKKFIVCLIVVAMAISIASTCFGFPAAGRYESVARDIAYETGEDRGQLWVITINESSTGYYGTVDGMVKGHWGGKWSVPISATKSHGRYEIEVREPGVVGSTGIMQIEENGEGSFDMNVALFYNGKPMGRYTASMNKVN